MHCYSLDVAVHWVLLWLMYVSAPSQARSRTMRGSGRGRYCAGPVLSLTPAPSGLRCAAECSSVARCVAYSHLAATSQCLLHDNFCKQGDLLAKPGALYVEVKWEHIGASSYYMPTLQTARNKTTADDVCSTLGAHLMAPETAEENDVVARLLYQSSYRPAPGTGGEPSTWISLMYETTWTHDWQEATYTNWASSEPNLPGTDSCTTIGPNGYWKDTHCSDGRAFLCEKDAE